MLALIALLVLLIILIGCIFATALYLCSMSPFGKTPPYIPSNNGAIAHIIETLDVAPGSVVYELGAGDLRVSLALWKAQPQAHYIGIEKHFWPRLIATWNIHRAKVRSNVTVREADFYKANLSDATHIYCYLYPEAMNALLPKFQKELQPGAILVSLDFPMRGKEPEHIIDLRPYRLRLGKTLYRYRF